MELEDEVEDAPSCASEGETVVLTVSEENRTLKELNDHLTEENSIFLNQVKSSSGKQSWLCIENSKHDDKLFKFHTGLPDYETFKAIFNSFPPAVKN